MCPFSAAYVIEKVADKITKLNLPLPGITGYHHMFWKVKGKY
jgi:hypothetical protein